MKVGEDKARLLCSFLKSACYAAVADVVVAVALAVVDVVVAVAFVVAVALVMIDVVLVPVPHAV